MVCILSICGDVKYVIEWRSMKTHHISNGTRAKKSLGQHFLKSEKALRQIVEAGGITASDTVLEIGPGTGILTNQLLQKAKHVVAVEKDRELIHHLTETFKDEIEEKRLTILEKDILTFDPMTLQWYGREYKLIANIPYYITGAIIEQFLSASFQPTQMVLLIQKEVAERIIGRDPSSPRLRRAGKKESVLSIAVKAYGVPKIIDKVPRGAFTPAPKVDSAIISINGISRAFFKDCDEKIFFSVLKSIFGKKRKQIGGSLAEYLDNPPAPSSGGRAGKSLALSLLNEATIDPKTRPEDLTLADWKTLAVAVERNRVQ